MRWCRRMSRWAIWSGSVHAPIPPRAVMPNQGQDQGADGTHGAGPARPLGSAPGSVPLPEQVAVPAQHCVRAHQQPHPAKRLWPQPVQQRRQQSPVRRGEAHLLPAQLVSPAWFRAGYLPAQDRDLVPEHQDLRVLSGVIPRQENQPAEHPDHGQVDEADQHERRA